MWPSQAICHIELLAATLAFTSTLHIILSRHRKLPPSLICSQLLLIAVLAHSRSTPCQLLDSSPGNPTWEAEQVWTMNLLKYKCTCASSGMQIRGMVHGNILLSSEDSRTWKLHSEIPLQNCGLVKGLTELTSRRQRRWAAEWVEPYRICHSPPWGAQTAYWRAPYPGKR